MGLLQSQVNAPAGSTGCNIYTLLLITPGSMLWSWGLTCVKHLKSEESSHPRTSAVERVGQCPARRWMSPCLGVLIEIPICISCFVSFSCLQWMLFSRADFFGSFKAVGARVPVAGLQIPPSSRVIRFVSTIYFEVHYVDVALLVYL